MSLLSLMSFLAFCATLNRMKSASALGFALLLLVGGSTAAQTYPFTREVEVPVEAIAGGGRGWVRVPLDLATLQHLAPEGVDLHVLGPRGREVPHRLLSLVPRVAQRRIRVVATEAGDAAAVWSVLLDVGEEAAPPLHEGLFLQLSPARPFPEVRLEGSADGTAWRELDLGALLPSRSGSASLLYPPTQDRYLRLTGSGQPPAVTVAEIATVQGLSLASTTAEADCDRGRPAIAVCRLALPATDLTLRRLTADLVGEGPAVGYRLLAPARGRWQLLTEGVWRRTGNRTGHLLLDDARRLAGGFLRLELYGAPGSPLPRLAGHDADLAVPVVMFRAAAPGRYTLAYGGLSRGTPLRQGAPANRRAAWVRPGPERAGSEPVLKVGAPQRTSWGNRRFSASWTVAAPSVKGGQLVRLEVPDEVYAAAQPGLEDLRLSVGKQGKQEIPYLRWSPPDPAPAAEVRDGEPEPVQGSEARDLELPLPAAGLPLTELWLTMPAGRGRSWRGSFDARYVALSPIRARQREQEVVEKRSWDCDPEPPLPCREAAVLPGRALDLVAVRLEDVEPGQGGLDLAVWRRRDALLFVWPEKGTVRLLAGSAEMAAPSYELAALGPLLLSRPWQPAEVDVAGAAALSSEAPRWGGWVRPGLLVVATILFLLLLRKILPDV